VYLLYLAGRVIFGPTKLPMIHVEEMMRADSGAHSSPGSHHGPALPRDLSGREICVLTPIAVMCVVLGVQPNLLLGPLDEPIEELTSHIEMMNVFNEVAETFATEGARARSVVSVSASVSVSESDGGASE
jgi:NADH:ubiquinone oxidoreductase subunit 4 (subunit M)